MILTFEFNFFMRYASFSTFTIATFLSVFVGYFMALSAMCKILHPLLLFFVPHFNLLHLSSISFSYPLFFSFPFSLSSFLHLFFPKVKVAWIKFHRTTILMRLCEFQRIASTNKVIIKYHLQARSIV